MYGLTPPLATDLLAQFEETGMGYVDYPGQHGYGISISSLPFVLELTHRVTTLRTVSCLEYGWDEHQDVVAGSRPGEPERSER
jgi:hypothetical protein